MAGRLERDAGGVAAVATVGVARARGRTPDAEEADVEQRIPPFALHSVRYVTGALFTGCRSCDGRSHRAHVPHRYGTTWSSQRRRVRLPRGRAAGPLALCLHGFPDSAWTWRHLLPALADAGFRAVAPFMRGYAPTAVPADGRYQTGALGLDACALHEALGGDGDAVIIGHDWGAMATYGAANHEPDRWRRVVTMAVPPAGAVAGGFMHVRPAEEELVHVLLPARPADMVVGMDDLAFIDRLWADWSPGYDGAEDIAHVKDALRDPANLAAALGYYRATLGGVGRRPGARRRAGGRRRPHRPAHALPARPQRRLHGRRARRGGGAVPHLRGLAARDRRRRRPLPPGREARRGQPSSSSTSSTRLRQPDDAVVGVELGEAVGRRGVGGHARRPRCRVVGPAHRRRPGRSTATGPRRSASTRRPRPWRSEPSKRDWPPDTPGRADAGSGSGRPAVDPGAAGRDRARARSAATRPCRPSRRGRASPGSTPTPGRPGTASSAAPAPRGRARRRPAAPGQHPGRVGVDHADVALEGEGQHGPGRVGTDARQREQRVEVVGQPAAVVARRPHARHRCRSRPGGCSRGPAHQRDAPRRPAPPRSAAGVGKRSRNGRHRSADPADLGLLEHQLAHEHRPRVAGRAPRQVAALPVPPAEDSATAARVRRRWHHCTRHT